MLLPFAMFIMFNLFQNCNAVLCADEKMEFSGNLTRNSTCEGSVCMYFTNRDKIDKTCVTTGAFNITNGCTRYDELDKETIACFCDTDLCNNGYTAPIANVNVMKQFTCVNSEAGSEPTLSEAPVCSISVVKTGQTTTILKSAENNFDDAYMIPITRAVPLDAFRFYVGVVHTTTGWPNNSVRHHYKCYGDKCNSEVIKGVMAKSDVSCHTNVAESCYGEFCVLATNGTTLKYCLSTQSVTNKQQYENGIFKYKSSTFYLCKENNCNLDEDTAKKSILKLCGQEIMETTTEPNGEFFEYNFHYFNMILFVVLCHI